MADADVGSVDARSTGWVRVLALSGAAYCVCAFAGYSFTDYGGKGLSPDDSVARLGEEYAGFTGEARAGAALLAFAAAFSLLFLGPLWVHLRRGPSWIAVMAVAGGVASASLFVLNYVLSLAAAVAGEVGDGQTARTLLVIEWEGARASVPPLLVTVAAAALAGLRFHVFPRVFSLFSAVMAGILAVGMFPGPAAGIFGVVGMLWVLVASLLFTFSGAFFGKARTAD